LKCEFPGEGVRVTHCCDVGFVKNYVAVIEDVGMNIIYVILAADERCPKGITSRGRRFEICNGEIKIALSTAVSNECTVRDDNISVIVDATGVSVDYILYSERKSIGSM
jgi:hypothetical protein